jgi:hypothetical protein
MADAVLLSQRDHLLQAVAKSADDGGAFNRPMCGPQGPLSQKLKGRLMASGDAGEASRPAWPWPPPTRPRRSRRRRILTFVILLVVLAGVVEAIGIPKILGWRFASQTHARTLEEAVTGRPPTRQTTVGALFIQLSGGFLPGDQEPVTIDRGKLSTPARIDTVMSQAAAILTAHGYAQNDSAISDPGLWNCEFDGTPDAQGLVTTATSMKCYVSRRHGREHAEIAVVAAAPPQYAGPGVRSSGPSPDLAGILVTDIQITVKD